MFNHHIRHRAPWYLADYCMPVSEVPDRQHLWSARCHQLSVPPISRSTFESREFSVAGPTVWNSLPDHLRDPAVDSKQFRWDLKMYLFTGNSISWRSWNCCDPRTRFVVIWKHFCFILSTGTRIWIDSVMRPRSSSRGAIQVPQLQLQLH